MTKGDNPAEDKDKDSRWRAFLETQAEARTGFDDLPEDSLRALLDEAVSAVRRRSK